MYSDGLLKLPIFTIQKNFKILLTVYSLSPHKNYFIRIIQYSVEKGLSGSSYIILSNGNTYNYPFAFHNAYPPVPI